VRDDRWKKRVEHACVVDFCANAHYGADLVVVPLPRLACLVHHHAVLKVGEARVLENSRRVHVRTGFDGFCVEVRSAAIGWRTGTSSGSYRGKPRLVSRRNIRAKSLRGMCVRN